mmetsp:Transcript_27078/g.78854  ORF Transcript_27078/g.78854 Transcript_27078/m.78854 type:complete len:263 (-) Transcript_27078:28-816(-)
MLSVHSSLDDSAAVVSDNCLHDFVVVATNHDRHKSTPREGNVFRHVLVCERHQAADLWLLLLELLDQLLGCGEGRHNGARCTQKGLWLVIVPLVHSPRPSEREPSDGDLPSTLRAILGLKLEHVVPGELEGLAVSRGRWDLQARHVRVQPDPLELVDALCQGSIAHIFLVVPKAYSVQSKPVQRPNHASALVHGAEHRRREEVPREDSESVGHPLALFRQNSLEAWQAVEEVHIIHADDAEPTGHRRPLLGSCILLRHARRV